MIRFDMSEFREEHSDARLFGAPPGYVGYEAGGELTKAVKQNPFSIVLFDEIEKAAPRIWDKFLQILGDGRLTDGKGETVSFTQSIIVFTSNLGITADPVDTDYARIQRDANIKSNNANIEQLESKIKSCQDDEDKRKLVKELYRKYLDKACQEGLTCDIRNDFLFFCFKELGVNDEDEAFNKFVAECVRTRIQRYFENIGRREVLGRIGDDNILVFNFMSSNTAVSIAKASIKKFKKYLKNEHDSQLDLDISEQAEQFILNEVQKSEVLNLGGRGIVTCVEKLISVPVGEFLFENNGVKLSAIMNYKYGKLMLEMR
jgi:ATP-dependent Clp protease ATP-binding subunit ClpA